MSADPFADALRGSWQERLARQPGALAIDWLGQGLSAAALRQRVEAEAESLHRLLEVPGGEVRIGVLAADGLGNLINGLALLLEGLSQAVLPLSSPAAERQALARRYALTHLLCDPGHLPDWSGLRPLGRSREGLVLAALAPEPGGPAGEEAAAEAVAADEGEEAGSIALLSSTSGTSSGRPSLVRVRRGTLLSSQRRLDWSPYDLLQRQLLSPDLQLPSPRLWKLCALVRGDVAVVRPAGEVWGPETFGAEPCGCAMPPAQLRRRLAAGDLARVPEGFLVITGGDHVPLELRRELQAIRPLRVGITLATSQSGPLTWLPPEELLAEPESVGRPLPTVTLEPVGEVRLRRFGLEFREMRVSKTRHRLRPDGRGGLTMEPGGGLRDFEPGDLLALSPSGHVIFGGRANDVFLFQGQLVSPFEIEDVLRGDPVVEDCVGFGAPSALYGAVPMAAVVLRGGVADPAAAADRLRRLGRERMGHRSAKRIVVVETLPRGPGGKPLRRVLAEAHALRL